MKITEKETISKKVLHLKLQYSKLHKMQHYMYFFALKYEERVLYEFFLCVNKKCPTYFFFSVFLLPFEYVF